MRRRYEQISERILAPAMLRGGPRHTSSQWSCLGGIVSIGTTRHRSVVSQQPRASEWVARLLDAQRLGRLAPELRRLGRTPSWPPIVDRLVHHAEILSLKGDSYRLRGKDLAAARRPVKGDES